MGYFKKRREVKEKLRRSEVLGAIFDQSRLTKEVIQHEVAKALRTVDTKRHNYEDNLRENLGNALVSEELREALITEVAGIIQEGMQLYTFKIAEGKRRKLAEQILHELAIKK